jgi:NADH-quinone oxidoreductase subunit J
VALLVAMIMLAELVVVLGPSRFGLDKYAAPSHRPADYSNTTELGMALFTRDIYAFEIAAVILLVGIIAAISLTLRRRPETKYLDPGRQVRVKAKDRIKIIKMDPEEKA